MNSVTISPDSKKIVDDKHLGTLKETRVFFFFCQRLQHPLVFSIRDPISMELAFVLVCTVKLLHFSTGRARYACEKVLLISFLL
jgi:hypothetical protein